MPMSEFAQFTMVGKQLYCHRPQGWLECCVKEAKERLPQIHDKTCGENEISLCRKVQRQGYYWPSIKADAVRS